MTPVTLKGGADNDAFLKQYLGKSDAAFRTSRRSLVFTGQGSMPKSFETEAQFGLIQKSGHPLKRRK